MTQYGFSIIDVDHDVNDSDDRCTPPRRAPAITSAARFDDPHSEATRTAARHAVRSYQGDAAFILRVRKAHAGQRNWLPNLRTAQALLVIINAETIGGVMR